MAKETVIVRQEHEEARAAFDERLVELEAVCRIVLTETPYPRRALYVGMGRDWETPAALGADTIIGVDPAYLGLTIPPAAGEALKKKVVKTTRDREIQMWLIDAHEQDAMREEMSAVLGNARRTDIGWRRPPGIAASFQGRERVYEFVPRGIKEYLHRNWQRWNFVITRRTFPSAADWGAIVDHVSDGGFLLTSGYGWGKITPDETGSGVTIHNSPLPLFFPSEAIGLMLRAEASGLRLYQKMHYVDRRAVADRIRRAGKIDAVLNPEMLGEAVAEVVSWDVEASAPSLYRGKPRNELLILTDPSVSLGYIADLIRPGMDRITEQRVWAAVEARARHLLAVVGDETTFRPHFDGSRLDAFIATGYLTEGDSLYDRIVSYLTAIAAGARRKSHPF